MGVCMTVLSYMKDSHCRVWRTVYSITKVTLGVLRGWRSTRIRPAASNRCNARRLVSRFTPNVLNRLFGSGKLELRDRQAAYSNSIATRADGVPVAAHA